MHKLSILLLIIQLNNVAFVCSVKAAAIRLCISFYKLVLFLPLHLPLFLSLSFAMNESSVSRTKYAYTYKLHVVIGGNNSFLFSNLLNLAQIV